MGQTVQTLKSPSRVEHFDFAIIPATETFFFYSSTDRMGWSRGRPLLDLMILLHRRKNVRYFFQRFYYMFFRFLVSPDTLAVRLSSV